MAQPADLRLFQRHPIELLIAEVRQQVKQRKPGWRFWVNSTRLRLRGFASSDWKDDCFLRLKSLEKEAEGEASPA
jgi:hypothetical protein